MHFRLNNRVIIQITGLSVEEYLQGLVTNDIKLLQAQDSIYSALLTPNGRFLFDFFVVKAEDIIYIDIADIFADDFISTMNKYKLRQKIIIEKCENFTVIAGSNVENAVKFYTDTRSPSIGIRNIVKSDTIFHNLHSADEYNSFLIQNKVVDGRFIPQNKGIILEYDFENLNGVSFTKGCYLGQELITRTKRMGQIRKQIILCKNDEICAADVITSDAKYKLVMQKIDNIS